MPHDTARQQKMFALIEAYQRSNLTRIAFCARENIPLARFHYWQKKHRAQHPDEVGGFIQVNAGKGHRFISQEATILLQYPNGVSLQLPASTPVAMIRTLLSLV